MLIFARPNAIAAITFLRRKRVKSPWTRVKRKKIYAKMASRQMSRKKHKETKWGVRIFFQHWDQNCSHEMVRSVAEVVSLSPLSKSLSWDNDAADNLLSFLLASRAKVIFHSKYFLALGEKIFGICENLDHFWADMAPFSLETAARRLWRKFSWAS